MGLEPLEDLSGAPPSTNGPSLAVLFLGTYLTLSLAPLAIWLDAGKNWNSALDAVTTFIRGAPEAFTYNVLSGLLRVCVLVALVWIPIRAVHWSWRTAAVLSSSFGDNKTRIEMFRQIIGVILAIAVPLVALAIRTWNEELVAWCRIRWAQAFLEGRHWTDNYLQGVIAIIPFLPILLTVVSVGSLLAFLCIGNTEYRRRSSAKTGSPKNRQEPRFEEFLWLLLSVFMGGSIGLQAGNLLMGRDRLKRTRHLVILAKWMFYFVVFVGGPPLLASRTWLSDHEGLVGMDPKQGYTAHATEILVAAMGQEAFVEYSSKLASRTEGYPDAADAALFRLGREASDAVPEMLRAFIQRSNRERGFMLDTLDRIDPQWASRPEVPSMTPSFCAFLRDITWVDDYLSDGKNNRRYSVSETSYIGQSEEETGENVLRTGYGYWVLRIIEVLNQADPNWKQTIEGKKTIHHLQQTFDPYNRDSLHRGKRAIATALLTRLDPDWQNNPAQSPPNR